MLRRLLALAAVLLLVPTVTAQLTPGEAEELKKEAVKDFKTFFRRNKDVSQRVEAVMTLKGNECVAAALELVRLLDHKSEKVRVAAMAVISTFKDNDTFESLINQLPDMKEPARQALVIEVLGRAGIKWALPAIRGIALGKKNPKVLVKIKIAEAIARMGDASGSNAVFSKFLADPDPTVRITAADSVGKLRIRTIGGQLVPLLHDKYWQVQAAAILAVGQVRVEQAIDPLIEIMRKHGRFKTDTADALFLITTKDFGAYPDQWAKSIKALRGVGWKMPSDADVAKAVASRKRSDELYGKKTGRTTFSKITTNSTRVLFIVDISGSMEDHVVEKAKFDAGYADYGKLTIVKTELINTIDALDRNTLFNVVAFATDLKPWKKGLVPANVVTKSTAISWVKRLRPLGGSEAAAMATVGLSSNLSAGRTNTFKALMYPFNINPDKEETIVFTGGSSRRVIKNKLDTVFFLSDGQPSVGKYVDINEILEEVAKVNKVYRMVLHTIAIGQFDKNFLRTLALQNGGEFVDLGY